MHINLSWVPWSLGLCLTANSKDRSAGQPQRVQRPGAACGGAPRGAQGAAASEWRAEGTGACLDFLGNFPPDPRLSVKSGKKKEKTKKKKHPAQPWYPKVLLPVGKKKKRSMCSFAAGALLMLLQSGC